MNKILAVDNTILSSWRACPRKWHYRHKLHLTKESVSPALSFGAAVHAGLAHWAKVDYDVTKKDECLAIALGGMPPQTVEREKEWRTPEKLVDVLEQYFAQPNQLPPLLLGGQKIIEADFALPLLKEGENPNGLRDLMNLTGYQDILYTGLIDFATVYQGGEYLVDHKTFSKIEGRKEEGGKRFPSYFWKLFKPHAATTGYLWALQTLLGRKLTGVMINGIGSNQYGICFGRQTYSYTPVEIEEWRLSTIHQCGKLLASQLNGNATEQFNTDACFSYGSSCQFLDLCSSPPSVREGMQALYREEEWNPLTTRKKDNE
jgi:hypothetical protein